MGLADQLIQQAGKNFETNLTQGAAAGVAAGAEIAQYAMSVKQKRAEQDLKQQELQMAKLDKVGSWFDTAAKMPEGAAKKAFTGKFIPNGINAMGMSDMFDPVSLQMMQADPNLANVMKEKVRSGEWTNAQLAEAAKNPEVLAKLMPEASQYGSIQNFQATLGADAEGLNKASEIALNDQQQMERAKLAAASQERTAGRAASKEDWKREDALRGSLEAHPISKTTYAVNEAYEKIQGIVKSNTGKNAKPTPAGDMSLVFAYMKMLDPASTVREGEQAQARDAAGVPDRVLNAYNQAVRGTTLNPKQRNDFLRQAEKIHTSQGERQARLNERYMGIADQAGVNKNAIVTGTEVIPKEKKEAPAKSDMKKVTIAGSSMSEESAKKFLAPNKTDSPKLKAYKEAQRKKLGY